jgi:hypothetical protein
MGAAGMVESTKALSEGGDVLPRLKAMGQTTQDTPADYRGRGEMFIRLIRYGAGAGAAGSAGAGSAGAGAGSAGAGAAAGASTGAGAGAEL